MKDLTGVRGKLVAVYGYVLACALSFCEVSAQPFSQRNQRTKTVYHGGKVLCMLCCARWRCKD